MTAQPIKSISLKVSALHTLDVNIYGNPEGKPVVFLHGGPGGGCSPSNTDFFDLNKWQVILFDQRGCGKSQPFAELRENTTWDLVDDIEKLRQELNIEKWTVFGGSWGSTLSLTYAESHPERCLGLVLRGIFLCTDEEIQWLYEADGAAKIFPDAYEKFIAPIKGVVGKDVVDKYYQLLTSNNKNLRQQAAACWSRYETQLAYLEASEQELQSSMNPDFALPISRIECHYFQNKAFYNADTSILSRIDRIKHLPTHIVHGRYDALCLPKYAWKLHHLIPQSVLHFIPRAGHSSQEPGVKVKLRESMNLIWEQV